MEIELGKLYLAGSMPSIFIDFLQLGRITWNRTALVLSKRLSPCAECPPALVPSELKRDNWFTIAIVVGTCKKDAIQCHSQSGSRYHGRVDLLGDLKDSWCLNILNVKVMALCRFSTGTSLFPLSLRGTVPWRPWLPWPAPEWAPGENQTSKLRFILASCWRLALPCPFWAFWALAPFGD